MLRSAMHGIRQCQGTVTLTLKRNIALTAPASKTAAQLDPIQQLFVDKIRDYKTKSVGGKLVDATPEVEKALKDQLDKVARTYGATGQDFSKFPSFSFQDPDLQAVGVDVTIKESVADAVEEAEGVEEEDIDNIFP